MKTLLFLLIVFTCSAALAKHVGMDGDPMMRETYAAMWKPVILNMFAEAGPTTVKLVHNCLVISNPNCADPGVKTALGEMFGNPSVRRKLKEIDMRVQCVSNAQASNP